MSKEKVDDAIEIDLQVLLHGVVSRTLYENGIAETLTGSKHYGLVDDAIYTSVYAVYKIWLQRYLQDTLQPTESVIVNRNINKWIFLTLAIAFINQTAGRKSLAATTLETTVPAVISSGIMLTLNRLSLS